jgi:hypothetical protein
MKPLSRGPILSIFSFAVGSAAMLMAASLLAKPGPAP